MVETNRLQVYVGEGVDTRTGNRVTSCSGRTDGTYFYFATPQTGQEAVRRLRQTAEAILTIYQK